MSILSHSAPSVHSKLAVLWPDDVDDRDHSAAYLPTPGDEAWWVAFNAALAGEPGNLPGHGWTPEVRLRWARGTSDGRAARGVVEARELGRALGESGSGISEPAAGYSAAEKAAFRDGYAAGLDDFDHAETLCRDLDRERELACLYGDGPTYLTDRDIYPPGCIG